MFEFRDWIGVSNPFHPIAVTDLDYLINELLRHLFRCKTSSGGMDASPSATYRQADRQADV